jgi:hypothetical protein
MISAFQLCFSMCLQDGQENKVGLEVNGTCKLFICADDVSLFGESIK